MTICTLPAELQLSIVELLDPKALNAFSRASTSCYELCVPALFNNVSLKSYVSLAAFIEHVPKNFWCHIRHLHISNHGRTNTEQHSYLLHRLLTACSRLERLFLEIAGSPSSLLISSFSFLRSLKSLEIRNACDEHDAPLSERLVVAIAVTVPGLERLVLNRITRSSMHATELLGSYPPVPIVINDSDIPPHPILGNALSLPSLLTIPSLTQLTIHDTHLGDPLWSTIAASCQLKTLDLGSFHLESDAFNAKCAGNILAAVGSSITELTLATSSPSSQQEMNHLRELRISPYVPVEELVPTVSSFSTTPLGTLSLQCYDNDVVETCEALEEFLAIRVERGPDFCGKLERIDVHVIPSDDCCDDCDVEGNEEAANKLQCFCRDVGVHSDFTFGIMR